MRLARRERRARRSPRCPRPARRGNGRCRPPPADPAVLVGKPVVKGTRLAVEFIIGLLAAGWTHEQILDNYPGLTVEDIRACLAYAGELLQQERVFPLGA